MRMARTSQEFFLYIEERPWGSFMKFADNESVTVKIITVKSGEMFSLHESAIVD